MTGVLARIASLRFGSLKVRIAVLYAGLFAAVLSCLVVIAGSALERFGEAAATADMKANARVFDELLNLRATEMRNSASVLSRDFGFRAAVATEDGKTIDSALASLKARSKSEAAFVVGLDGSLLGSGDARIPNPETLWYPLDAGQDKGIIRLDDRLALAAAARIEAPDLIGWLVLAQPLDRNQLDQIADLAAVDVQARVERSGSLPDWLQQVRDGKVLEHTDAERSLFHVSNLPALEEGLQPRLVLRHSLDASLAQYANLQYLLLALGFGSLILIVALSWRVARTVSEPLQMLDEATRLIGEGRDVELNVESDDEIGRLAKSFNAMVGAIEDRERRIIHVGLHDGLTGLPNRKLFVEQLEQSLSRLREAEHLMLIYVDLDDFKVVNDTLGHPAGDALLRNLADTIRSELPDALVARLGGDEFAVMVDHVSSSQSLAAQVERIQASFDRSFMLDGTLTQCSASLGIAIAPGDGLDGTTLMKNADLALYRAKSEGKSTYHFFEPSLDEEARRRRQMELDLRLALRDGGFELYFQPLFSVSDERLNGFEALIRWPHPEQGMISPAEFIPLAEETGLIIPIGEWVIQEACRLAAEWPDNLSVAVNISPKQFSGQGLPQTILQALAHSGLHPSRLELEITESIFIANVERTLATLHSLRDLGVRIALDDFGTGYSSLSYLRSFPFDKVKIDRSFVQDLEKGGNSHAVIRAITTLADALGMETLAEGVESTEQLAALKREGCQYIQGYLFGRPMSASAINDLLQKDPSLQARFAA